MVMPPAAYDQARLEARYHVQVELAATPPVEKTPAHVPVVGRVRRIFRGDDALRLADEVRFAVAVCRPGDLIPCGGDFWMYLPQFEGASLMEVFLNGTPPECRVASSQISVIEALTDTPCMRVPTERDVAAAWAALHGPGFFGRAWKWFLGG
jgi:hypothetical protein